MGLFNMIREKKDEFQRERNISKANKLKDLKDERVILEGRAKVNKAYDDEKAKIKAAKKQNFDSSFLGRAVSGAKKLRAKSTRRKASGRGSFIERKEINSAFSLGKEEKPIEKRRTITIKL